MLQLGLIAYLFVLFGQSQANIILKKWEINAVMKRKDSNCVGNLFDQGRAATASNLSKYTISIVALILRWLISSKTFKCNGQLIHFNIFIFRYLLAVSNHLTYEICFIFVSLYLSDHYVLLFKTFLK